MTTKISSIKLSAFPSTENAQALYLNYQRRVFKSLLHVAEASSGPLNIDITGIKILYSRFESEPISSYLFAANCVCVESLKNRNGIENLKRTLEDFNRKSENDLIFVLPEIKNISEIKWVNGEQVAGFANTVFEKNRDVYSLTARVKPVPDENFNHHKSLVSRALGYIKNSPASIYFDELCRYVSVIGLYDGIGISGWSSEQHIGAIFIRNSTGTGEIVEGVESTVTNSPPLVYYVEQLIHETAHVHLDLIMETEKLFLNGYEANYISPIRYDLRPMRGVFHAVFVLTRIFKVLSMIRFPDARDESYRIERCKVISEKLKPGFAEIKEKAELTEIGREFLSEMAQLIH